MIKFSALLFILWSIQCFGETRTLRVDFYHTGDHQQEIFSLDQVIIEPLVWPGSKHQTIDILNRGKYRFIVRDKTSNKVLYTRSFSSIYGEWETTGEAKKIKRTFHESLRFPKPENAVNISIEKRDAKQQFKQVWKTEIDPDYYLNHFESANYKEQVITIEQNGSPTDKVDLLILGDGYTANEITKFRESVIAMVEVLFATSPFKEHRNDFNIWALAPAANNSGVSRPSTGTYHDSPLGVTYDAFGSERYVLTTDNRNLRRIASSAPYDFIEIIVNSETYGGGGIFGLFSTVAANSDWANYVFIHEFGHHFAGLADEYYTSSVAYMASDNILEPYEPNVTALLEGQALKWQHLVKDSVSLPTKWPKTEYENYSNASQKIRSKLRKDNKPESEMDELFTEEQKVIDDMFLNAENNNVIGAFEGANYSANGYYRSEMNCLMFTRTDYFCQVCRQSIIDMIELYSNNQK